MSHSFFPVIRRPRTHYILGKTNEKRVVVKPTGNEMEIFFFVKLNQCYMHTHNKLLQSLHFLYISDSNNKLKKRDFLFSNDLNWKMKMKIQLDKTDMIWNVCHPLNDCKWQSKTKIFPVKIWFCQKKLFVAGWLPSYLSLFYHRHCFFCMLVSYPLTLLLIILIIIKAMIIIIWWWS